MAKRKVAGGYELSESSESDKDEAPKSPKKPRVVFAPARLLAPKFNAPTPAHSHNPPSSSFRVSAPAVTPSQKAALSSTLRTSLPTPCDTPNVTANSNIDVTKASKGVTSLLYEEESE
jgi:hypothetical protein